MKNSNYHKNDISSITDKKLFIMILIVLKIYTLDKNTYITTKYRINYSFLYSKKDFKQILTSS